MSLSIDDARAEFSPAGVYLNTASVGLPPQTTVDAVRAALDRWQLGTGLPPDFDAPVAAARRTYAGLVGVDPADVAIGAQTSTAIGLVAANLPPGAEVVIAEGDFTSVVYPVLAQAGRGVRIREVPLQQLLDVVTPRTDLVAVSAVQSADGRIADLDGLAALRDTRTKVLLDTTQAVGWLPIDASRYAYTAGGGYKWLLGPRGAGFFTIAADLADTLIPHAANWYAGPDPWASLYGGPLGLASDARRFDLSPIWYAWVGQATSLDLLAAVGVQTLHAHAVALANRFRAAVGLPAGDSAIVSVPVDDAAQERLRTAGVVASLRAGRLRLAFHLYSTEADADAAAAAVGRVPADEGQHRALSARP